MPLNPHSPLSRCCRWLALVALGIGLSACGGESSESRMTQAQQSLAKGDRPTAIIHLKSIIQDDPRHAEARFRLGKLYLETGDYAGAEKELQHAREAGYDAGLLNPALAKAYIGQGAFQRALDELPAPAADNPAAVPMHVVRAHALLSLGERETARAELRQAQAHAPDSADVRLVAARLALAEGNAEQALEEIEAALKADPKHLDAWLFKGSALRSFGKHPEAIAAYQAVLKLDPAHDGARLALAGIALAENRLADARREAEAALKAARSSLQPRYLLALIDFREKKFEAARDRLAAVLKHAPNYPPAVLLAGSIEYALGNMQTAETHFGKSVAANPKNLYALRLLAAAQLRQGRADDAARTLAPVPRDLEDAGFQFVAGEIALARKQYSEAATHFERAAQLQPDNAAIRTELGVARLARGDPRALADLQAAADMDDARGRADMLVIINQLRQKQFDAALVRIDALEKKLGPTPLVWNYRGAAHLGKEDWARARDSFNQALKLDPAFFPAAANLAQLHLRDKQPAQARALFEATLKSQPTHLDAMLAMAELSLRENNRTQYVAWLEKAARAHPQALRPRAALNRHYLEQGDRNKALAIAREAADANPDSPAALLLLGNTQLARGDTLNAVTTFVALTKKAPQSADAFHRLAVAQRANEQSGDARASLQRALHLQPTHLPSLDLLGRLELSANNPQAALQVARQAQTHHPKSPLGFVLEGDIHHAQKRLPQAVQAYEQAMAHGGGATEVIKLHRLQLEAGNTQAAEARLAAWLANYPDHHAVRTVLANHFMSQGRPREAITHYQALQQRTPPNAVVLNNLASLYQRERDPRALATAEQALKLAPDNSAVQDTLGWILVEQGQTRRGLDLLRRALAGAPKHPGIRYHHAAAQAQAGNRAQARSELEKLLADTPQFPEAEAARALLKRL